jgi:hypothetical protein
VKLSGGLAEVVQMNVVATLWETKFWANPLQSLFEALNYTPMKQTIVQSVSNLQNSFKLLLETSLSVTDSLNSSSFYTVVGGCASTSFETTETEVELTTRDCSNVKDTVDSPPAARRVSELHRRCTVC